MEERIGETSSLQVEVAKLDDQLKETENRVEKIIESSCRQATLFGKMTESMISVNKKTIENNKSIKYVAIANLIIALTLLFHILFS